MSFQTTRTGYRGRWNRPELQRFCWTGYRSLRGVLTIRAADWGGESGVPRPHGGNRHHEASGAHDDADDRIFRRIRPGDATRENPEDSASPTTPVVFLIIWGSSAHLVILPNCAESH
jgi:hypothetical protein